MYDKEPYVRDNISGEHHILDKIPAHPGAYPLDLPKRPWLQSIMIKLGKISAYTLVFFVVLFVAFYLHGSSTKNDSLAWINYIPIIGQIKQMAEGSSAPLRGEERGRINILILGIGGKGHDGAELTDTMMVMSFDTASRKVSLLSVPRDLSVPIESMGWRKINSVNALSEQKSPGSGGTAASQAISNVLAAPIDYYVKVDFDGFVKLIDQMGGLDVCVDNTFDDMTYPADGQEDNPIYANRYEHLHFEKGCQKMNGTVALKYARSRHSFGAEGTDFARARRQQKIIEAVKERLLSKDTIFNPSLIASMISNLTSHIDSNMKIWEMAKLWTLVKDVKREDIATKVLSNSPEGLLMDTVGEGGAYLLMPRTGNFSEVQYLFKNIFSAPASPETIVKSDNVKIQVMNGTWINGLASKMAVDLEKMGFKVVGLANSSRQDFETSVIYDLTFGQKEQALKLLKEKTGANVSFNMPDWLKDDLAKYITANKSDHPELVLILGTDANKAE
ncbi:MAG: LCP family protein [Candidatus Falkowbacteria bacterium]